MCFDEQVGAKTQTALVLQLYRRLRPGRSRNTDQRAARKAKERDPRCPSSNVDGAAPIREVTLRRSSRFVSNQLHHDRRMLLPSAVALWLCSYAPTRLQLAATCSSATSLAPHSNSFKGSSFSPLLPPAIPLAVKSPCTLVDALPVNFEVLLTFPTSSEDVNAWLPAGGDNGNGGYLTGAWARHWPINYGHTEKQFELGWAGIIRIDDEAFVFLGDPLSEDIGTKLVANQTSFKYTATRSIFGFEARGVDFTVTFLSPVTPHDYVRTSLPLSFLSIDVDPKALKKHHISVYSDINGGWASGDVNADLVSLRRRAKFGPALTSAFAGMGLHCPRWSWDPRDSTQERIAVR